MKKRVNPNRLGIDPNDRYSIGFRNGYNKGRRERKEEDIKYGSDICVYGLMYYVCEDTHMSYEDVIKLYDGMAFNMDKMIAGYIDLKAFKKHLKDKYNIELDQKK